MRILLTLFVVCISPTTCAIPPSNINTALKDVFSYVIRSNINCHYLICNNYLHSI